VTAGPRYATYAAFDQLVPPRGAYFQKDGIHLTDAGDRELAAVLSDCIAGVK